MVHRTEAFRQLNELLGFFPAVGLIGPRQVGKTTLVKQWAKQLDQPTVYLDLESSKDRSKLTDPHLFLAGYNHHLVILDEIQYMPGLMNELRGIIDADRRPGRFLILGSASPELMQKSSESLAGRIGYLELTPFNLSEVGGDDHTRLWVRGGFPDSFLAPTNDLSFAWRRNFVKTYVERDIPRLGLQVDAIALERFWRMLAGFQGNIWNAENFSRSLGVTAKTVNRYLNFMESAFLIHRLPPYSANLKKRLVKAPKIYLRDSGVLHFLYDLTTFQDLKNNVLIGASWEGHVIEQIRRKARDRFQYFFYRTHQGTECDLVLVRSGKVAAAVEIKYSSAPVLNKGLHIAIQDLKSTNNFVIVPEGDSFQIGPNIKVSSLPNFLIKDLPNL
jgi:predicted AAA+ superfamily ATPase